jgi:cytochrome P450
MTEVTHRITPHWTQTGLNAPHAPVAVLGGQVLQTSGITLTMRSLRPRILGWVARTYALRASAGRLDLSKVSMLPDTVLWPLRRTGLDPVAELGRRRAAEPVSRLRLPLGIRAWLVTGYDEVRQVLGSVDGFSNDFGRLAGSTGLAAQLDPGGLGFTDPPDHTRLRRLLTPEFTMRRLSRLAPRIESIIEGRLDVMAGQTGPVDLWQTFALPIPALTICELLGVPYEDRAEFQALSTARFDMAGGSDTSLGAMSQSVDYLLSLIARLRTTPGDGLLSALIQEHGSDIDDLELAGLADGVLTGGLETSASMLALGALVLMDRPETAEAVRHGAGIDGFVEELLRYLTVVQVAFPRFAVRDVDLGGVRIAEGDVVVCHLSAANRDEVLGAAMDVFDPGRVAAHPHMAFGHGIHRCVGSELARMELRAAYPALLRRFPRMRPAGGEASRPFRDTSIVYGVEALPVRLD